MTELTAKVNEMVSGIMDGKNIVSEMGKDIHNNMSIKTTLLRKRLGEVLKQIDGNKASIPQGLVNLKNKLDTINPHTLSKPTFIDRLLGKNPLTRAMANIARRYESVQSQVDGIEMGLREGSIQLSADNLELEKLAEQLKIQQEQVGKAIAFGEEVVSTLEAVKADPNTDPNKVVRITEAINAVVMKTQDFKTIEQVNSQFLVSIDLTIGNNNMLMQSIDRTLTITTGLITVGLSIQAALVQQKQILEATKAVQEYAADIMEANALSAKSNLETIKAMYQSPIIGIDRIKKSYDTLTESLKELHKIKEEGTTRAKDTISKLNELTIELKPSAEVAENFKKLVGE